MGLSVFSVGNAVGAERQVDPTFLHRNLGSAPEKPSDVSTATCHYKPLFGAGDSQASALKGVSRFGEVIVDPWGACKTVSYGEEDQIYVVLDGGGETKYAAENVALRKEDYIYLPATVPHALTNRSAASLKVVVMGFRTNGYKGTPLPAHPLKANIKMCAYGR